MPFVLRNYFPVFMQGCNLGICCDPLTTEVSLYLFVLASFKIIAF